MVVAVPLHQLEALLGCLLQTLAALTRAARHEHLEEGCRSHTRQRCLQMH